ncbi:MAG: hypothetical protein IPG17_30275 [Sandaracinaceae bacterium]|nr:hypothetical protein [Sandaracinaceae bacterium]
MILKVATRPPEQPTSDSSVQAERTTSAADSPAEKLAGALGLAAERGALAPYPGTEDPIPGGIRDISPAARLAKALGITPEKVASA